MSREYAYDTSAEALLYPAKGATFFEAWDPEADTRNHDLLCAEMSRLAYANQADVRVALARIGFEAKGFLRDDTAASRLLARGTQGFLASNAEHGLTVLAFRGTEVAKVEDVICDLNMVQRDFPAGGRVQTSFEYAG